MKSLCYGLWGSYCGGGWISVSHSRLLGLTTKKMSEGENKQAADTSQEGKPESMAAAATGQTVSSVSPPVSMVTQPPATAATEDEEEESEDESEILEESPCGRWQKRREEVFLFISDLLSPYQPYKQFVVLWQGAPSWA